LLFPLRRNREISHFDESDIMKKSNRLSIALMGTRGVPAKYGGFETCVDEVGRRLAARGHDVTVYCRSSYYPPKERRDTFEGMRLIYLPNLKNKSMDTFSHTFLSVIDALKRSYDVHMVFNAANSLFILPLRLAGKTIAVNTDGLERRRYKWGFVGQHFYKLSERVACFTANRLVSDSKGIRDYYLSQHNVDSSEIAYGAPLQSTNSTKYLEKMGLEKRNYFLQITRFEPENYPLLTVQAFKTLNTNKKLVLVGGNPYPNHYTREIEREAAGSVLLPGFIYDREVLKELWCNCYAYVHGNFVGGTNPALLQTMASGCFTIASDIMFNRDVLDDCGIFYKTDVQSLADKMQWTLDNEDKLCTYRKKAQQRIKTHYTWDKIADQYEKLFFELIQGKYPWR
jgi:glycosyltransferase involved in cell wall biosynthesis